MKTYRIGYFSKRINAYTDKYVRANNYEDAIKKSRIKNIEDIEEVESDERHTISRADNKQN